MEGRGFHKAKRRIKNVKAAFPLAKRLLEYAKRIIERRNTYYRNLSNNGMWMRFKPPLIKRLGVDNKDDKKAIAIAIALLSGFAYTVTAHT